MTALSALVHAAAVVALFLAPKGLFSSAPPPIVAYTVSIVDPNALGGRLPKGPIAPEKPPIAEKAPPAPPEVEEKPPAPEPKPPEPEAKAPPEPEKPPEKTVTLPDAEKNPPPPPKPETKPQPKKPTKEELARAEAERRNKQIQEAIQRLGKNAKQKQAAGLGGTEEGKGKALGVGGDGGGGGVLTGLDFVIYKNQVESIIKQNWTWVGANPNLTVRVGFGIEADGQVTNARLVSSSGDPGYDQSVLRAIQASSPLPAPPEKYRDVFANYIIDFVSGELQAG
jgi:TonB family protein